MQKTGYEDNEGRNNLYPKMHGLRSKTSDKGKDMILISMHHSGPNKFVVALCDENLIGKTLEDKEIKLVVAERFYKGEKKSEKEIEEILKHSSNINFLGKESIDFGIRLGIIGKENVIKISGVPHAQFTSF